MAADGKIHITITEGEGAGGNGNGGSGGDNKQGAKEKESKLAKYTAHQAYHFVMQETKQIINHYASTIGERTGDYLTQDNVQASVRLLYKGMNIASMAIAGFQATGTPVGAAIGAGVGLALSTTNEILSFVDYYRQIKIMNNNIEVLRVRAGFNSINDGSRGGN